MWKLIVWFLPTIPAISIGMHFGSWWLGIMLAAGWLYFCRRVGSITLEKEEYAVIERFGKFRTVLFRGQHTIVPGIDTIVGRDVLNPPREELYAFSPRIQFLDGVVALLDASAWYRIGRAEDVRNGHWDRVSEDVRKWFYANKRTRHIIDRELRLAMRTRTIAEAHADRHRIANAVAHSVEEKLKEIGVYPRTDKKLLDIEPIIKNRSQR